MMDEPLPPAPETAAAGGVETQGGPTGGGRPGAGTPAGSRRTVFEPFVGPSLKSPAELMARGPARDVIAAEASRPPSAEEIAAFQQEGGRFIEERFGESLPSNSVDEMHVRFPLPHGKGQEVVITPAMVRQSGRSLTELAIAHQAAVESMTNLAPQALRTLRPDGTIEVVYWERSIGSELDATGRLRWTDPATGIVYRLERVGEPALVPREQAGAPHSGHGIGADVTEVHVATMRKVAEPPAAPPGGRETVPPAGETTPTTRTGAPEPTPPGGPGPAPQALAPTPVIADLAAHLPAGVRAAGPQESLPIGPGWANEVARLGLGDKPVLYVLRDVATGEILKVGLSDDLGGRLGPYQTATLPKYSGRRVAIDVLRVELDPNVPLRRAEGQVRTRVEGSLSAVHGRRQTTLPDGRTVAVDDQGRIVLPWDNTDRRLGYAGPGTPGTSMPRDSTWRWGVPEPDAVRERLEPTTPGSGRAVPPEPPQAPKFVPPQAPELTGWVRDWLATRPPETPPTVAELARRVAQRYEAQTGQKPSESLVASWLRKADLTSPAAWRELAGGE
jgi:hypothetical protein